MTSKPKASVRVRGTCTAGHVTETRSTPGRVTWEGTCGHDGCQLPIHARRVPKDTPPPPADTTGPDPTDRHRVIEVTSYEQQPKHPRPAEPAKPAGDGPPAADATGADDGAAPAVHGRGPVTAAAEPAFEPDPRADPGPREIIPDIY